MSRTVSARIPTELHEELRERCNLVGESINDFVTACIEMALHNSCEFNFGDELMDELESQK
jgi:predicted HicB family RNase H-like nuclease